jgi:hypothetical protein
MYIIKTQYLQQILKLVAQLRTVAHGYQNVGRYAMRRFISSHQLFRFVLYPLTVAANE